MSYKSLKSINMNTIKLSCFIFLVAAGTNFGYAQQATGQSDMTSVLKKTFDDFDAATSQSQKIQLSGRLGLIAAKWNNEWITHYYLAYSKVVLSENDKLEDAKRDALLDEADNELNKAVKILGKENDETHVLGAFIANWRIAISPMTRYMVYGKVFTVHMETAKAINPDNPRIYYLRGMAKYGMPKFAGGGEQVALPYLAKADSLYAKESEADITKPYWGKATTARYLKICKAKN
jgi:hypothetical protein